MKRHILIGVGILVGATVLCGQTAVEYGRANFQIAGVISPEGRSFGVESLGSQIVTGKPFSATEERHSVQVLGDGTHIENSETNRLYRDEQGRTRIERKGGNITIFDPVAGFSAELDPATKTMSKTNVMVREGRIVGKTSVTIAGNNPEALSRLKLLQEKMSTLETQYAAGSPRVNEVKAQIADLEKSMNTQGPANQFFFTAPAMARGDGVTAITVSPAQADQEKHIQANYTYAYSSATGAAPAVLRVEPGNSAAVDSLPAQMVNGALAEGTRTTETIPAGKIGNDRPISVVNERWYSNSLQMLVKSTSSDPRFGDTTYQLTGIVQASPDASLFQIPGDYTIRK